MFKVIVPTFIFGAVGLTLASVCGVLPNVTYSEGQRTGNIVKISEKGIFCKSMEGQMNMNGVRSDNGTVNSVMFEFSVVDEKVFHDIQEKAKTGQIATITYKEMLFGAACQRDTNYIAMKVE